MTPMPWSNLIDSCVCSGVKHSRRAIRHKEAVLVDELPLTSPTRLREAVCCLDDNNQA
jgi:hypothetical protein